MQNNHQLTAVNEQILTLWRYPKQSADSPLQAWDSADNLIVKRYLELTSGIQQIQAVAILNDAFGAICCQLTEHHPVIYQDSKVSQLAISENLKHNGLDSDLIKLTNEYPDLSRTTCCLLKIPKSLDYLEEILAVLHLNAPDDLTLIAGAKANHINKSVVKLFNRYFSQVDVSLAEKKSRTITASGKQKAPYSSFNAWTQWKAPSGLTFKNAANVFSRSSLDMGAAFMLDHLPKVNNKAVIDLACGNGVLGFHLLKQKPLSLVSSDDSYQAILSAQANLALNFENCETEVLFKWQDCLTEQDSESADTIVCNPPFHQQHAITDHIANQMFEDAYRCLKQDGELYIVGNRHLGYHQSLAHIFKHSSIVASNKKFVIIKATK